MKTLLVMTRTPSGEAHKVGAVIETPGKGWRFFPLFPHLRPSRVFHATPEATLRGRIKTYFFAESEDQ